MKEPTQETLEDELRQVLSRHAELLSDPESAALAAAACIKTAEKALRPKLVETKVETHEGKVGIIKFPEAGVLAFFGTHQPGDWLDEITVDVEQYNRIELQPGDTTLDEVN